MYIYLKNENVGKITLAFLILVFSVIGIGKCVRNMEDTTVDAEAILRARQQVREHDAFYDSIRVRGIRARALIKERARKESLMTEEEKEADMKARGMIHYKVNPHPLSIPTALPSTQCQDDTWERYDRQEALRIQRAILHEMEEANYQTRKQNRW